MAQGQ